MPYIIAIGRYNRRVAYNRFNGRYPLWHAIYHCPAIVQPRLLHNHRVDLGSTFYESICRGETYLNHPLSAKQHNHLNSRQSGISLAFVIKPFGCIEIQRLVWVLRPNNLFITFTKKYEVVTFALHLSRVMINWLPVLMFTTIHNPISDT